MTDAEEFADFVGFALESFAPATSTGDVSLGGRRGSVVSGMLDAAIAHGSDVLQEIALAVVTRLLAGEPARFTDEERQALTDTFAAVNGTADQLARALLRDYLRLMEEQHTQESLLREEVGRPVRPLSPEAAVEYFRSLVPTLGTDPEFFGATMRRAAFTLTVATEQELLSKVQTSIAAYLATGEQQHGRFAVARILESAGVSPKNLQYAEMVFRTNAMDAYNTAADEERQDPDVIDAFPVWKYSNPGDSRSRPEHAARDGKYYPANVPFRVVRGLDAADACNCRCVAIPVYRREWAKLQSQGARVESGW